jgi:hypothetical protein
MPDWLPDFRQPEALFAAVNGAVGWGMARCPPAVEAASTVNRVKETVKPRQESAM